MPLATSVAMREESLRAAATGDPPKRERGYMVRGERAYIAGIDFDMGDSHQHH